MLEDRFINWAPRLEEPGLVDLGRNGRGCLKVSSDTLPEAEQCVSMLRDGLGKGGLRTMFRGRDAFGLKGGVGSGRLTLPGHDLLRRCEVRVLPRSVRIRAKRGAYGRAPGAAQKASYPDAFSIVIDGLPLQR
jgi:hypothetical protein